MKTFIFCTSYIGHESSTNNSKRLNRWLKYYSEKLDLLDADKLILIDDGSESVSLNGIKTVNVEALPNNLDDGSVLFHFPQHLGRPTHNDYRGWWRSFTFAAYIANRYGYDKVIHIESDFFILTKEMMEYIKNLKTGWTTFYSEFHRFPESAIQIICQDQLSAFLDCYEEVKGNNFQMNKIAERYFPFSHVERGFVGDRLGQFDVLDGWLKKIDSRINLDYIGQILPEFNVEDYEDFFELKAKWE